MTNDLTARLREAAGQRPRIHGYSPDLQMLVDAADALEAKDREIEHQKELITKWDTEAGEQFARAEAAESERDRALDAVKKCLEVATAVVAEHDSNSADLAILYGYRAAVTIEERIRALLVPTGGKDHG